MIMNQWTEWGALFSYKPIVAILGMVCGIGFSSLPHQTGWYWMIFIYIYLYLFIFIYIYLYLFIISSGNSQLQWPRKTAKNIPQMSWTPWEGDGSDGQRDVFRRWIWVGGFRWFRGQKSRTCWAGWAGKLRGSFPFVAPYIRREQHSWLTVQSSVIVFDFWVRCKSLPMIGTVLGAGFSRGLKRMDPKWPCQMPSTEMHWGNIITIYIMALLVSLDTFSYTQVRSGRGPDGVWKLKSSMLRGWLNYI